MRLASCATILCGVLLSACVNRPPTQASITGEELDQVVLRIKQEVGAYQAAAHAWRTDPSQDPVNDSNRGECITTNIDFDIPTVKAELKTVVTGTSSLGLSLKIPFAQGLGSISPGVGGARTTTNTQILTLYAYPKDAPGIEVPALVRQNSPIAVSLAQLRSSLIKGGKVRPCFELSRDDKDADNTFQIGFEVVKDENVDLGFSFVIVSLDAKQKSESTTANVITVSFRPRVEAAYAQRRRGRRGMTTFSVPAPLPSLQPGAPNSGTSDLPLPKRLPQVQFMAPARQFRLP